MAEASLVTFSPDGRFAALIFRAPEGLMEIWDLRSRQQVRVPDADFRCAVFSPDGRQFAAAASNGVIHLWQTDTWGEPVLLVGSAGSVLAISPDGRTVASAGAGSTISLWNAATGRELLTFESRMHQLQCLRFSPDGSSLAVCGAEGMNFSSPQVIIWQAQPRH
jgi:WD40 repeat protein